MTQLSGVLRREMPATGLVALIAAALVALAIALTSVAALPVVVPQAQAPEPVPDVVLQAGREWQRQREQQSWAGVDPLIEAGREWERQRDQQSGQSD